jgi:hypothetical protein
MYSHRQALSTAYLIVGLFFGYVVVRDFDSILTAQRAFFDLEPAWYAAVFAIVIAAAPLGLMVAALLIFRKASRWLVPIPAIYGTVFSIGYITIALAVYLAWYLVVGYRETIPEAKT